VPRNKTNWAQRLDQPPYEAHAVTTGLTFTFGSLKISNNADIEDTPGHPITGLYVAGEIASDLYYDNYASGTAPMSGASFERIAERGGIYYGVAERYSERHSIADVCGTG
jgi:tricarballylate dehydrogenase